MKKVLLAGVLSALLFYGCEGDYVPSSRQFKQFQPRVVVNSLLCPDSLITIRLCWSRSNIDTLKPFVAIDGAKVELFEEGQLLYSGLSSEGLVETPCHPVAGRAYQLKVHVAGQPEISARTSIPQKGSITFTYRPKYRVQSWGNHSWGSLLVDVSAIAGPQDVRALLIRYRVSYDDFTEEAGGGYSDCPYLDPFNSYRSSDLSTDLVESSNHHSSFLRLLQGGVAKAAPFTFGDYCFYGKLKPHDPSDTTRYFYATHLTVELIAPSEAYDRYCRTYFKHAGGASEFVYESETASVYSNIENGVGIFAGYNLFSTMVEIDNPLKP